MITSPRRRVASLQALALLALALASATAFADPAADARSPGRSNYESITLESGVTQDPTFAAWADAGAGSAPSESTTSDPTAVGSDAPQNNNFVSWAAQVIVAFRTLVGIRR